MKISIKAVLAGCTLFYFGYFLQLTLELVAILYFHWQLKKMLFVLTLVPAPKQQFNEFINGKENTINRNQKSNVLFLQR